MDLLILPTNIHELGDIRDILKEHSHIDLYTPQNISISLLATNISLQQALEQQAAHHSKRSKKWCLAATTTLTIPTLSQTPYTATKKLPLLLDEISKLEKENRSAYLETHLCLTNPHGSLEKHVRTFSEGRVCEKERGNNGYGFDFIFIKESYDKTLAELSQEIRNKVSPLRKALDKLSSFFMRHASTT